MWYDGSCIPILCQRIRRGCQRLKWSTSTLVLVLLPNRRRRRRQRQNKARQMRRRTRNEDAAARALLKRIEERNRRARARLEHDSSSRMRSRNLKRCASGWIMSRRKESTLLQLKKDRHKYKARRRSRTVLIPRTRRSSEPSVSALITSMGIGVPSTNLLRSVPRAAMYV